MILNDECKAMKGLIQSFIIIKKTSLSLFLAIDLSKNDISFKIDAQKLLVLLGAAFKPLLEMKYGYNF